jgi:tetratricopeptide (TPR) repeat protein
MYRKGMTYRTYILILTSLFLTNTSVLSQNKEHKKEIKRSQILLGEADKALKKDQFPLAEADYRKAIALNPKDETPKYNLGTAYYNREMNDVAMKRFQQAAAVASEKIEKHKAFHNLGNTFMNSERYKEAVEAYKNALRNDPTDDETRYNLALAKKLLEDQQQNGGDDGDDKNKEDQNKDDQNNENQDKQDKNKEEQEKENQDNKEGDEGDKKEEKDDGKENEDKKEGDENKDKGSPKDPKDEEKKQQQPVPGKLSNQQIKNLLDAMNNEEKKVQDKINAKKQKGAKVKSNKDW